jgi:hypothetical protein
MKLMSEVISELQARQTKMLDELNELQLGQLRNVITNEQLPPQVRDAAFQIYKARGGDGWYEVYYENYVKTDLIDTMEFRLGGGNHESKE